MRKFTISWRRSSSKISLNDRFRNGARLRVATEKPPRVCGNYRIPRKFETGISVPPPSVPSNPTTTGKKYTQMTHVKSYKSSSLYLPKPRQLDFIVEHQISNVVRANHVPRSHHRLKRSARKHVPARCSRRQPRLGLLTMGSRVCPWTS